MLHAVDGSSFPFQLFGMAILPSEDLAAEGGERATCTWPVQGRRCKQWKRHKLETKPLGAT
eukprot:9619746-Alexandrium_andersonii.AAC.1